MPYISSNYMTNPKAPAEQWTCAPTSALGPFTEAPSGDQTRGPHFCGQCVSYVKTVCPTLPATVAWKKGKPVKDNKEIAPGTAIATFNSSGRYEGHAAIYVSQSSAGINVYDQWVTPPSPKAMGPRMLRWGARGNSNNGDNFYVVE